MADRSSSDALTRARNGATEGPRQRPHGSHATGASVRAERAGEPDVAAAASDPHARRPGQRASTSKLRHQIFDDATTLVQSEYAADLSLDDVAHRVATSRRQLQRIYAEIGQTTFRRQLRAVRMQHAAELLTSRTLTVGEVA